MRETTLSVAEVIDQVPHQVDALRQQVRQVIVGQDDIVEPLLLAMLVQGHVLVVGVPGLAKTLLVKTLAAAMQLTFHRIQFTPDMMPSDILGTELIQQDPATGQRSLRFVRGPIFAQMILADEINRTPPKTQAALLEAMAERQVTTAGQTLPLGEPFVVVATQNPIEQEGTYPLPEAQQDRFMFSLWMDYPSRDQEVDLVAQSPRIERQPIEPVLTAQQMVSIARSIEQMPVSQHVVQYAVDLARASRPGDPQAPKIVRQYVAFGAGPRAGQQLIRAARALAAVQGQPTPHCQHVQQVATAVLRHRIVMNYQGLGDGVTSRAIVDQLLEQVQQPDYQAA